MVVSRKECLGILYIGIAALCTKNVLMLYGLFPLGYERNLTNHIIVLCGLASNYLMWGLFSLVLHSRNSLSHTFVRVLNACTGFTLSTLLAYTRRIYYMPYQEQWIYKVYPVDFLENHEEVFQISYIYDSIIITFVLATVIINVFLAYSRVVSKLRKRRSAD